MERVYCCLHNNNMYKNTYLVNNYEQIYNTREDNRDTGFDKGDVMTHKVLGIHHITAISGAPHENYDFYVRTLGLKLVKKTVNYDDPGTYHLYYGDETGSPGSLLTFFPYEGKAGKPGPGQATATGYAVPKGQLSVWEERLASHGIVTERGKLFGEERLSIVDPHGMGVELTETEGAKSEALGTFHKATITLVDLEPTRELLEFLGYQVVATEGERIRMAVPGGEDFLDLVKAPKASTTGGPGTVHHIALRLVDDASQKEWRRILVDRGYQVSPITDRNYFHSIYFRGPEGVLYELATDPPGMLIDEESAETLGQSLKLPPQYEKYRQQLEDFLAPLEEPFRTVDIPGQGDTTLVGLHGTGGDEHDLIPLLRELVPEAPVLTLRGQVSENGHARFFRRLREGVFDQKDLIERSQELSKFLDARAGEKALVGYSNGANIAAHALMFHPEVANKAVLIRPMLGWTPPTEGDLGGKRVLLLIGGRDTVVPPQSGRDLAEALRALGAEVETVELPSGHELTADDVAKAKAWLNQAPATVR